MMASASRASLPGPLMSSMTMGRSLPIPPNTAPALLRRPTPAPSPAAPPTGASAIVPGTMART
jgi:hypothetical protein